MPIKTFLICVFMLMSGYVFAQPSISSISPLAAAPGGSITIKGNGFGNLPGDNIVFFGGAQASITAASTTSLSATVPIGALLGPVSVTVSTKTVFSTQFFVPVIECSRSKMDTSTFQKETYFGVNAAPKGAALADLDGDGKLDLVVPNYGSNNVSVFQNKANAGVINSSSFNIRTDISTLKQPYMVALGDLDGDGRVDMVVSGAASSDSVQVFLNTSSGSNISFGSPVRYAMPVATGGGAGRVRIMDMDADGFADIVVAYTGKYVCIFQNKLVGSLSSSSFTRTDLSLSSGSAIGNDVAIADMDDDGLPDILAPDINNAVLNIFINKGSLSFTAKTQTLNHTGAAGITVADFDGDGLPDIAGTYINNESVFTFINSTSTSGSLSLGTENDVTLTKNAKPVFITPADLNGDGRPDLVIGDASGQGTIVMPNNSTSGSIVWDALFNIGKGNVSSQPVVGDIDGDGMPDIISEDNDKQVYCIRTNMGFSIDIAPQGKVFFCKGDSIKFTSVAGPGLTYQWIYLGAPISGANKEVYYAKKGGSYTVKVSGRTCSLTSSTTTVLVQSADTSLTLSGSASICPGDSVTITASSAASYQWRLNGKDIPGATGASYTANTNGAYRVVLVTGSGCRDSSRAVNVVIESTPDATVTVGGPLTFCTGSNVKLSAISKPGYKYQWMLDTKNISGATKPDYLAGSSGKYTVKVTTAGGCFSAVSSATTISSVDAPVAAINAGGPKTFCKGGSVVLTGNADAGLTYQWYKSDTLLTGENKQTYTAVSSGRYKLKITNGTGCSASDSTVITVNANPLPGFSHEHIGFGRTNFIADDNGAGDTYLWKFGDSTSATGKAAFHQYTADGSYNVTLKVTNTNGCSVTKTVTVVVNTSAIAAPEDPGNQLLIYPNPAKAETNISYKLQSGAPVIVYITDILGRVVYKNESLAQAGLHSFIFKSSQPGNYIVHIATGNQYYTQKIIMVP